MSRSRHVGQPLLADYTPPPKRLVFTPRGLAPHPPSPHHSGSGEELTEVELRAMGMDEFKLQLEEEDELAEVPVRGLIAVLRKHAVRVRNTREVVTFSVLILAMVALFALQRFSGLRSHGFWMVQAAEVFFNPAQFHNIAVSPDLWKWLHSTVDRLWDIDRDNGHDGRNNFHNAPLSFLMVRQRRVKAQPCALYEEYVVFPQSVQDSLPDLCFPEYAPSFLDTEPFGQPGAPWLANSARATWTVGEWMSGTYGTYTEEPRAVFSTEFLYNQSVESVHQELRRMQQYNWLDNATRVVDVQAVLFNPDLREFIFCDFMIEVTPSSQFITSYRLMPFSFHKWLLPSGEAVLAMLLDCVIVAFTLHHLVGTFLGVRHNLQVLNTYFTMFDVVSLTLVITMFITYVYRVDFWVRSNRLAAGYYVHNRQYLTETGGSEEFWMFDWLTLCAIVFDRSWLWYSLGSAIAFLRLFGYLQYTNRLNALSMTIRHAWPQLLSMTVISTIVVFAFAYIGNVIYGYHLDSFQTISASFGTLFVFMLGDVSRYPDMLVVHPDFTPAYVLIYFFLAWLLLLNMVLAIITGSFAVMQEALKEPDWSLTNIFQLKKLKFWKRGPRGAASDKAERQSLPFLASVNALMRLHARQHGLSHAAKDEQFVTREEFQRLAGGLTREQQEYLLYKSLHEYSGRGAHRVQTKRQLARLLKAVTRMEKYIYSINGKISDTSHRIDSVKDRVAETSHRVNELGAVAATDLRAIRSLQEASTTALLEDLKPKIDQIPRINHGQEALGRASVRNQAELSAIRDSVAVAPAVVRALTGPLAQPAAALQDHFPPYRPAVRPVAPEALQPGSAVRLPSGVGLGLPAHAPGLRSAAAAAADPALPLQGEYGSRGRGGPDALSRYERL